MIGYLGYTVASEANRARAALTRPTCTLTMQSLDDVCIGCHTSVPVIKYLYIGEGMCLQIKAKVIVSNYLFLTINRLCAYFIRFQSNKYTMILN